MLEALRFGHLDRQSACSGQQSECPRLEPEERLLSLLFYRKYSNVTISLILMT